MSEKAFCVMCIRRPFLRALLPKAAPARKGCCDNCGTKTKSLVAIASDDSDDKQLPVKLAYLLQDKDLNLEALHIKEVQKITQYDPKREAHVPTRFCSFNLYKFDLNEESDAPAWPPLKDGVQYSRIADQSVNVTSLRVVQSDRGYPISLYGQVLARDQVDYKCVYLFRRQRDDPQVINGPEDILALDGPYRGLAFSDYMFFEIHLKVKGDGDEDTDEDFSKGVIQYGHVTRPIIKQLPSFRSTVSLVLQLVQAPALAMVAVNILEGVPPSAPFKGRITAGTTRNYKRHMVLYDSRATGDLIGGDHSVLLSRNLVAVPCRLIDHQGRIEIHVCFLDHDYEDDEYADDHSELTYYDYVDRKWKCKGKEIEIEIDEDEDEDEDDGDGDDGDEEDDDGEEDDGDEDEEADGDEDEDDDGEEEEEEDGDEDEEADDSEDEDALTKEDKSGNFRTSVIFRYPEEQKVFSHGPYKLQAKVSWSAILDIVPSEDIMRRWGATPSDYRDPDYASPKYLVQL